MQTTLLGDSDAGTLGLLQRFIQFIKGQPNVPVQPSAPPADQSNTSTESSAAASQSSAPAAKGAIGGKVFGWRAQPIFRLVKPIGKLDEAIDRTKERESKERELENRREEYKNQQTLLHGKPPPTDMVKRAMPDLAEPSGVFGDDDTAKFIGFVPHSFMMPHKRIRLSRLY